MRSTTGSFSFLGVEIGSAEVIATLSAEATRTQGTAYTLTQRVEHTTGPIEDGVLFTTVPVDQYTYIIVSHPNPELVGGEAVVSLPRDPITALTTRDFLQSLDHARLISRRRAHLQSSAR